MCTCMYYMRIFGQLTLSARVAVHKRAFIYCHHHRSIEAALLSNLLYLGYSRTEQDRTGQDRTGQDLCPAAEWVDSEHSRRIVICCLIKQRSLFAKL